MTGTGPNRRRMMALLAASVTMPRMAWSTDAEVIELTWSDLIPDEAGVTIDKLREMGGVVQHGQLSTPFEPQPESAVTTDFDGENVRIPGYIIPLEFEGVGATTFILVPYVGACIHVPPPPANQLIFVQAGRPYASEGLFEPVYVTGSFASGATETELADIGYQITEAQIEPYEE